MSFANGEGEARARSRWLKKAVSRLRKVASASVCCEVSSKSTRVDETRARPPRGDDAVGAVATATSARKGSGDEPVSRSTTTPNAHMLASHAEGSSPV